MKALKKVLANFYINTFIIMWPCYNMILKKQETHFDHGYLYCYIDFIVNVY